MAPRFRGATAAWLLALGAIPGAAILAQAPPLGGEFEVNTYTTGSQRSSAVASRGDGSFVVVWQSDGQDGSRNGVFGQLFDRVGAKAGPEFQVNTYTTGNQGNASVAVAPNGDFVVVWATFVPAADGSPNDHVFGQRFHATVGGATKAGTEFQVNTGTSGQQIAPSVGMDASGNFVVAWLDSNSYQYELFGQRFDASGAKVGAAFPINASTTKSLGRPRVAENAAGQFVVVWHGYGAGGSYGVFGQRFSAAGAKVGTEIPINTFTSGGDRYPAVAMDSKGNFVVAWNGANQDGSGSGVIAQRFNAGGEKVGGELLVNTYTTDDQEQATVALDASGGFLVSWTSVGQDGSLFGVFGQRFDRRGVRIGGEFPINTYTTQRQSSPAAASDGVGFVVTWDSYFEDGSTYSVFGRRQILHPERLTVDAQGVGTSDLNGVLEPGDAAVVVPTWSNNAVGAVALTGTVGSLDGPAGPVYQLLDGLADYGSLGSGFVGDCNDGNPNPCYAVQISGSRPATHWDATMEEDLSSGGSQLWTLHLGDSFADVPRSQPFYKKIETLLHNGITTGCNATQYCPSTVVSRDAMAIFIAKGIAGLGELVPSTGLVGASAYSCTSGGHSLFADVSPTDAFCKHVHYLAAQNVTLGCDATHYCPAQTVTRDAMASFIAKAVVAPGGGAAVPVSYTDPTTSRSYSCISGSANLHFSDVSVSNAFCKHIHYLWARGIVDGCTPTTYCPTAPVARDAMAKFIANGFGLQLYGP